MAKSQRVIASHSAEFIPDRGPTEYFHGRKKIMNDFNRILQYASKKIWGTTFLIHGAPGVGKTALLYECRKLAEEREWKIAKIGVESIWNPYKLLDSLGLGDKYKRTEKTVQFGWKSFFGRGYRSTRPQPTVENILKDGEQPLLLILDEAQALEDKDVPLSQYKATAIHVLELIHNGELGRPVILLAGGLDGAKKGFGKLRISRFAENCLVELGALSEESEHAVIQDWLIKEGGAKGDPAPWINAIGQETYGWPQHVHSYARRASDQLKTDGGVMTLEGLQEVLEAGREGRKAYYRQRIDDFRVDQIRCLARSIADVPHGEPAEYRDIMSSMMLEYGEEGAGKLFDSFVEKGLLKESGMGYAVPIPSMHNWLKDEYVREKVEVPREPEVSRSLHERNS